MAINQSLKIRKFPPTVRELGSLVGLSSPSSVHGHLDRLEKNGYLKRDRDRPRTIELTRKGLEAIGETPKDIPITDLFSNENELTNEEAREYFPTPPNLSDASLPLFMLKYRADSLVNRNVLEGDKLVIMKHDQAKDGDIVLVSVNGELIFRTYQKEGNKICLQPENDHQVPIYVKRKDCKILGIVKGVYRNKI